ncbi:hypothetical protein [Moorena sp. SIO4G3]|uniref:hypothetical protein n=1 Tax=Moorena sp. SIO4G3 TaxID=2607821 RepID=UPI00142B29AE|nr:hypothetical protein [Moorena sp. SIO4G3]NEO75468.1 hypothetical protein [Moorena sp. SIO4G3]
MGETPFGRLHRLSLSAMLCASGGNPRMKALPPLFRSCIAKNHHYLDTPARVGETPAGRALVR